MGLSNELSCMARSFSGHCNLHRFLQPWVLRLSFSMLEPWVAWSESFPSCSFWFIHMQMWDHLVHQLQPCHESYPIWLPVSTPPTSLDECFFFDSLVVRLPYSLIFLTVLVFFVLNLLLAFFWLCEEAQCIYLCLHLGQKSKQ